MYINCVEIPPAQYAGGIFNDGCQASPPYHLRNSCGGTRLHKHLHIHKKFMFLTFTAMYAWYIGSESTQTQANMDLQSIAKGKACRKEATQSHGPKAQSYGSRVTNGTHGTNSAFYAYQPRVPPRPTKEEPE